MFKKKTPPPTGRQRPSPIAGNSAAVFSYHASRSATAANQAQGRNTQRMMPAEEQNAQNGAAEQRRKGNVAWHQHIPRKAVAVLVVLLLLFDLLLIGAPTVVSVHSATGGQLFLHTQATYDDAVRRAVASSVFNRTKPTISTKKLEATLRAQFPELSSVRVSVPVVGLAPTVYIEPPMPALLMAASDGQVYVLDGSGKALAAASDAPQVARMHLPLVADQSGLSIVPGKTALPRDTVAFITEVAGQLKAKELTTENLTLPRATSELDVRITGVGYTVKYNITGNARVETGAYLAVKQHLDEAHITPGSYVDVRVDGRAYYK